jgi:hypothetical protein
MVFEKALMPRRELLTSTQRDEFLANTLQYSVNGILSVSSNNPKLVDST